MLSIFTTISSFPLVWQFWENKLWRYPARFLYLWHYDSLIQNTWTSSRWRPLKLNSLRKGNGLELFVQQLLLALTLISAQKCFSSRRQVRTNCINLASRNETTRCQLSCFYLLTLTHRNINKIFILQTNFSKSLAGAGFLRKCWVFPALQHTHTVAPFGNIYHFRQLVLQLQRHRLLPR